MIEAAVIDSGGRGHELGRQLSMADEIGTIHFLNGNAGTAQLPGAINIDIKPGMSPHDVALAASYIEKTEIDFTIIGPEAPLVGGLADVLRQNGRTVLGPSSEAVKLESSKNFAGDFMRRKGIPHPPYKPANNYLEASDLVRGRQATSYVIKADGLAGGKGVVLPSTFNQSHQVLKEMFYGSTYGDAGKNTVLIQERYHGPELSVLVVSDGTRWVILPPSQDYKRQKDNDEGPNTGGMGAYAPVPETIVTSDQWRKIEDIVERTINGMAEDGTPYQGVLYLGLMLSEETGGDPVVIEYNARFGDPETQVVLPVLSISGIDVYNLLRSAAEGNLEGITIPKNLSAAAISYCLADGLYPQSSPKESYRISGLDKDYEGVIVHHGGTKRVGDDIVTAGGRVLYVTGIGKTLKIANANALNALSNIHFEGMQYRSDIGRVALI